MAALAVNMPRHVLVEASSTNLLLLLQPDGSLSLNDSQYSESNLLEASIPGLDHLQQSAEAADGSFPASLAFVGLLHALLLAGVSSGPVQVVPSWH